MPDAPTQPSPDSWYYLSNFERALTWIAQRYSDLLNHEEHAFLNDFAGMPQGSRGLLVRMLMRKGCLFRLSKLQYPEIGPADAAVQPLAQQSFLDMAPLLTLNELFGLLTRKEIGQIFRRDLVRHGWTAANKASQLDRLQAHYPEPLRFDQWLALAEVADSTDGQDSPGNRRPATPTEVWSDRIVNIPVKTLCERFRLMFFGNLRQDWSEFVLAHLGVFHYEKVDFIESSRAFESRQEIDDYLHLNACRERLSPQTSQEELADMFAAVPQVPYPNEWLESRRGKLLFLMGQMHERRQSWDDALLYYRHSSHPQARIRRLRVLERAGRHAAAAQFAGTILAAPENALEAQCLTRMMPRLLRRCGGVLPPRVRSMPPKRHDLHLPASLAASRVEEAVRCHFAQLGSPVFYVENALINSLFGLLCWDAIFAPVPGAFFHPFQQGPADLLQTRFHERRQDAFDAALAKLASGEYKTAVRQTYHAKWGVQSPFVTWQVMTPELLELALHCIPAPHLDAAFRRLLSDIRENRSGLPDLIQFWPEAQRYRMIEVKGPGDRLQDNQARWLAFCTTHELPVCVCYVQWEEAA
jgi:hypothetical protein